MGITNEDVFDAVRRAGFYPDLCVDSLTRVIGNDTVRGFWIDESVNLDAHAGVIRQVNVTFVTDRRLVLWVGHDTPVAPVGAENVDTSIADIHFVQFAQTVPLRRVNDVQVTTRTSSPDGDPQLESVQVVITTATPDVVISQSLDCGDEDCSDYHGVKGDARNDLILLLAGRDTHAPELMDRLVAFAGEVENRLI